MIMETLIEKQFVYLQEWWQTCENICTVYSVITSVMLHFHNNVYFGQVAFNFDSATEKPVYTMFHVFDSLIVIAQIDSLKSHTFYPRI